MQEMQLIVIVLVGLSLGTVAGLARVPVLKWVPYLSSVVLLGGSYAALQVIWQPSVPEVLVFLLAVTAGNVLYGARLWRQLWPELGLSYWAWVQRDSLHTGSLRRLYRSSRTRQ